MEYEYQIPTFINLESWPNRNYGSYRALWLKLWKYFPLEYIINNCKNKVQQVKLMSYTTKYEYRLLLHAEKTHLCLNIQRNARLYVRRTTTSVQAPPASYLLATSIRVWVKKKVSILILKRSIFHISCFSNCVNKGVKIETSKVKSFEPIKCRIKMLMDD